VHRERSKDSKAIGYTRIQAGEEERVYFVSRRKGECEEFNNSPQIAVAIIHEVLSAT